MASEQALIGNEFVVQIGDGNSPPAFTDLCFVTDITGVGEEKPLVETTAYCDDGRTYRNGLKDGAEVTVEGNFIENDVGIQTLKDAYDADALVDMRLTVKGSSPAAYIQFSATVRAWTITAPIGERAVMQFTAKISGVVTWNL